ncbi:ATP-binding protein [Kitasatospora sp. NPDC001527]|uniref:ATP-binding protein n=1 Tax=Kitasatospora sp. NPDC001527 TaxID=3154519 RepID=UPI00333404C5
MTSGLGPQPCPRAPYGVQKATWAVGQAPAAVARLRADVADVLQEWGVDADDDQLFAVVLVLTELVTNAGRYGRPCLGLIDVDLWLEGRRVVIAVMDSSTDAPVMREVGADGESGRGLRLIGAYAEASGYEIHRTGKRVWAVIGPHVAPEGEAFLLDAAQIVV